MYAWVFGINGRVVYGRTWKEFIELIDEVVKTYDLSISNRLIVYVHNLSHEFQFFRKLFEWEKVFAVDNRKPLYAITKSGIEFRCSYLLSGYNLQVLGKNLTKYKVEKLKGDLDYRKLRHTETPLTENEWKYIRNDALVVMAHIQEEIERLGDITKIPLTKTGYVREFCREKCFKGESRFSYGQTMKYLTLDSESYMQMRKTYMGGFSHANINYVGKTLQDVHSFDFTSSYPAVMITEKYPMSKPFKVKIKGAEDFNNRINNFCCMFQCVFYNLVSKTPFENYISKSKCIIAENPVVNNGRVVKADKIIVNLTELDYKIISKMYSWDYIEVGNFYCMYKDYLPKPIVEAVLELYQDKTTLKDVTDKIAEYLVKKGMINAMYGMCVTDVYRDENEYTNDTWVSGKPNLENEIEKYNKNRNRFLYYPWGIWVTAYARRNLFTGILEFGDDYVYSDTDSLKVLNPERHIEYIREYNRKVLYKAKLCLEQYGLDTKLLKPKTIKGVEKPIGIWDYEGKYTRFKTLGAKRYLIEKDGNIEITIAGVNKDAGKHYLEFKYKTNDKIFRAFKDSLKFPAEYLEDGEIKCGSGKLCHTYIDNPMCGELVDYLGNKCEYTEASGVHLENTSYDMSLSSEFMKLLLGIKGSHIKWYKD